MYELILSAINTADCLQRRVPYMALTPSWCHMCHSQSESVVHLFLHCNFAALSWHFILQVNAGLLFSLMTCLITWLLCWLVILSMDIRKLYGWLSLGLLVWFFGHKHLFQEKSSSFELFMDVISTASFWCKYKHPFKLLHLSFLVAHWRSFMKSPFGVLGYTYMGYDLWASKLFINNANKAP